MVRIVSVSAKALKAGISEQKSEDRKARINGDKKRGLEDQGTLGAPVGSRLDEKGCEGNPDCGDGSSASCFLRES